jgi:FAD:protein FMN transferase
MSAPCDISFRSMGSDIRLIVEAPLLGRLPAPLQAAEAQRRYVEDFAMRLSRFRDDSELCALNRDPRSEVPASILLRTAVSAGLWAAHRSAGLVDPTLVDEIESVGYEHSQEGHEPASLTEALAGAPPLRPARANPHARFKQVEVDDERGTVRRPPGVRIDTGGTGKGLAADAIAHRLRAYTRFVVDCGGDIAVGGVGCQTQPLAIEVEHPLTGECIHTLRVSGGGVATSGLNVRIWRDEHGRFAHHLLDPSSGQPVWSGLIGATALAPSALEAETLTKIALLSGPMGARRALATYGGLIVHNSGDVELLGPLARPPKRSLHLSGSAA